MAINKNELKDTAAVSCLERRQRRYTLVCYFTLLKREPSAQASMSTGVS